MKQDPWAVALSTSKVVPQTVSAAPVAGTQASGGEGDFGAPLRDPHPKEFDPPQQYSGSADNLLFWSESFKDYVGIKDPRWKKLLAAVESLQGVQVTDAHEKSWDRELKLGGIGIFKNRLHMYFKQYLKGAIRSEIVQTGGETRALDAWRILADRGCSQRPEALHLGWPRSSLQRKQCRQKKWSERSASGNATLKCIARPIPTTSWTQICRECC